MLYKILLLAIVAVAISLHEANAQTPGVPADINQTSCTVLSYNNVENPFTLTLDHDPTLTESVSHTTTNPSAALQSIGTDPNQAIQGVNPKTHLSFSSNDTTNWTIVVQLTHPDDKSGPRTLLTNLYSKQANIVSNDKIVYYGTKFCGIFQIQAVPPVHVQTNAEIIALAAKYSNLTIGNFANQVHEYAKGAEGSSNNSGFISIVVILLGLIMYITHRVDKKSLVAQEENAKNNAIGFKNATIYMNASRKHQELKFNEQMKRHDETLGFVLEQFVNVINHTLRQIHNSLEDNALYFKTSKMNFRPVEEPQEIILPQIVETVEPDTKTDELIRKIPMLGKLVENKKKEKKILDDRVKFWYDEYRKNLDTKYKGKFEEMFKKLYPIAEKDSKCEERAQIEAMCLIIDEDGKWP